MTIVRFHRASSANRSPLSDEQIMAKAPAVFAHSAHQNRGKRYVHIPTHELLSNFREHGFLPYDVSTARIRKSADQSRNGFQKHLIRFRPAEAMLPEVARVVGDLVPEVVMINSHDGSSSYELLGGIFRFACANGLIVADAMIGAIRVRHTGRVLDNLIEGSYEIAAQSGKVVERVEQMRKVHLGLPAMRHFAEQAIALRWDAEDAPVSPDTLVSPRRSEDTADTLWNVFNRAQEALLRGGNRYWQRDDEGRLTMRTTRPINGITQSVEINRNLWQLAERELARAA